MINMEKKGIKETENKISKIDEIKKKFKDN